MEIDSSTRCEYTRRLRGFWDGRTREGKKNIVIAGATVVVVVSDTLCIPRLWASVFNHIIIQRRGGERVSYPPFKLTDLTTTAHYIIISVQNSGGGNSRFVVPQHYNKLLYVRSRFIYNIICILVVRSSACVHYNIHYSGAAAAATTTTDPRGLSTSTAASDGVWVYIYIYTRSHAHPSLPRRGLYC